MYCSVLLAAVLPYLLWALETLCCTVSFTGPDRMNMLCVLGASGSSRAGTTLTSEKRTSLRGNAHEWFQSWVLLKGLQPFRKFRSGALGPRPDMVIVRWKRARPGLAGRPLMWFALKETEGDSLSRCLWSAVTDRREDELHIRQNQTLLTSTI